METRTNKNLLDSAVIGSEIRCFGAARSRQGGGHVARDEEIVLEHLIECGTMTRVRSQQLPNEGTSRTRDPLRYYVHVVSDPRVGLSKRRSFERRLAHQHCVPRRNGNQKRLTNFPLAQAITWYFERKMLAVIVNLHNATHSPQIGFITMSLAAENFRSNIIRCSTKSTIDFC